uniref:Putative secreted protein n=1 Tax=Ixodes ricinus TaxID=34613 RepID=V5H702_IXORI
MKATLVAICFIAAVAYSMGRLTEEQCRAPVPSTLCAPNAQLRTVYSFNNNTNKCEPMKRDLCGRCKTFLKNQTSAAGVNSPYRITFP